MCFCSDCSIMFQAPFSVVSIICLHICHYAEYLVSRVEGSHLNQSALYLGHLQKAPVQSKAGVFRPDSNDVQLIKRFIK